MNFEERPAWMSPMIFETIKDDEDKPIASKIMVGLNFVIEDTSTKFAILEDLRIALEKSLKERQLIDYEGE